MYKSRIWALQGKSPNWPSTYPHITHCVACVHWMNDGISWGSWVADKNPLPIHKEGREEMLTWESVCIKSMYIRNALFAYHIQLHSVIFERVSQHRSYEQKSSIINNSWLYVVCFSAELAPFYFSLLSMFRTVIWVQSKDWSFIHTLCSSLGTVKGCTANPRIFCAKLESEVCAGQSSDSPNPYLVHNIHIKF